MGVFIKQIRELANQDKQVGGSKATSLGNLFLAGFPIPPGFVITSEAFKTQIRSSKIDAKVLEAFKSSDLVLASESIKVLILNTDLVEDLKNVILSAYMDMNISTAYGIDPKARELISSGRDPPRVVVRRSVAHNAESSELASSLNVKGKDDLIVAVKKCWASVFTPDLIKGCRNAYDLNISVLVQKFINSTKSGLVFTQNPKNQNSDELFVVAGYGLGGPVIKKEVDADEFVLDKPTGSARVKRQGRRTWKLVKDAETSSLKRVPLDIEELNNPCLSDRELEVLAKLAKNLEAQMREPQVFEWAIEGHRVYLLQTKSQSKVPFKVSLPEGVPVPVSFEEPMHSAHINFPEPARPAPLPAVNKPEPFDLPSPDVMKMFHFDEEESKPSSESVLSETIERRQNTPRTQEPFSTRSGLQPAAFDIPARADFSQEQSFGAMGSKPEVNLLSSADFGFGAPTENDFAGSVAASGKRVRIKALVDMPLYAERLARSADGVGVLKLEPVILSRGVHPNKLASMGRQEELVSALSQTIISVSDVFRGKPVWVKLLDLSSDDLRRLSGGEMEASEKNPLLGFRGVRRSLAQQNLLNYELQAIKRAINMGCKDLGLIVPFVTDVSEVRRIRDFLMYNQIETGRDIKLGASIETPASAAIVKDLCSEGINFVSIDLDRFSELMLAVDKDNPDIRSLHNYNHPAIKQALDRVIKDCKDFGVEVDVHGQGIAELAGFLKELGVDSVSAGQDNIERVRQLIA